VVALNRVKYVAVAVVLVALGVAGWAVYRSLNPTLVYTYRIQYADMPATDDALADWLKAQPGVTQASVRREGDAVVVRYEVKGDHSTPDVVAKSKDFGYSGLRRLTATITGRR
jgi:hypothetical protein